jgi:hypothetical protein
VLILLINLEYLKMIRQPLKICYWFAVSVFKRGYSTTTYRWRLKVAFIFKTSLENL